MSSGGPPVDELVSRGERDGPRAGGPRSWVVRALLGVILVATATVVGPRLLANPDADVNRHRPKPTPSSTTSIPTSTTPAVLADESPMRWKIRGDLAGSTAFLSAAKARAQQLKGAPDAAPLYAATLPDGGRVAILAVLPGDVPAAGFGGVSLLAVHVPAGASVENGRVMSAGGIAGPDDLAGWAGHGAGGRLFAVVFGRPAPLDVEISSRIEYRPDGAASRRWRQVSGRNGSLMLELRGKVDPIVAARQVEPEDATESMPVMLTIDGDPTGNVPADRAPSLRVDGLTGSRYRGPDPGEVRISLIWSSYGLLDPTRARIRVLWSGRLIGDRRCALLRLRRPDGASFQTAIFQNSEGVSVAQGMRSVRWADADVVPWLLNTGEPDLPLLLVVPSGRGEVVVRPSTSRDIHYRVGTDGLVNLGNDPVVAADRLLGAAVTVLDRAGHRVVRSTLSNTGDDPYVLAR